MIARHQIENPKPNPVPIHRGRPPATRRASAAAIDWAAVIDRLGAGDPEAYRKLSQLVTGFLSHWRAFDLRDTWDDIVQDVATALLTAGGESRITTRAAAIGFIRSTTRFKFIDRINHSNHPLRNTICFDDLRDCSRGAESEVEDWKRLDLDNAVSRLPAKQRAAVVTVHVGGYAYEEAAVVTGIPLGSLKRHLRQGLEALRESLAEEATGA